MWEVDAVDRHQVIIQIEFMALVWSKMIVNTSFENLLYLIWRLSSVILKELLNEYELQKCY